MIEIRDYQIEGIKKIYDDWERGIRSVMFQMPTGTGKTVLFNQIVKQELARNSTVLIMAHLRELIEQNERRLREDFQIEAGIIMAGHDPNLLLSVQVASIQTLSKREYPSLNPSLIIIDEAHHVPAQSYVKLLSEYPEARILGVTATPIRLSGKGFTGLFDTLITSNSIAEFIKDGYLAPIRYLGRSKTFSKLDLSSVSIVEGDYDLTELSQKMRDEIVMANLIQSYLNHAKGEQMIVFAVDVEHSEDIAKRYKDEGFVAAHLDATTSKRERDEIISKFRTGEIQILSNVGIVSEGFDVPDCKVVQLARPTKSLAMYLQQVGRCMRKPVGKQYCIVLDNVGLYEDFGSPRSHRNWTLGATINAPPVSNSSSNSRESDPLSRTKPEETDEDLIILEDFDMPIESETISKLLFEIDDELTKLEEVAISNSDISNTIAVLRTVKDCIDAFLSLPCYDLLVNVPNPLSISHFVASKDNSLKLAGKSDLFRGCDFVAAFSLPATFDKPVRPVRPDPFTGEEQETYYKALEAFIDWEDSNESKVNLVIDKLSESISRLDILRKYDNFRRAVDFVSSQDANIFDGDEELDLFQLPETTRQKILSVYRAAFQANPTLLIPGETLNLIEIDPACSLDSVVGIDAILAVKENYKGAKYGFLGLEVLTSAMKLVKSELNAPSLIRLVLRLNTNAGSSINSSSILTHLKMLHGIAPRKR